MSSVPSSTTAKPLALALAPDHAAVKVALVIGGALLTAMSAQVVIPMWPAPITGQTFAVLVVGAALGARLGSVSMVTYLATAGLGLPFFAEGASGWSSFAGPTAGYLVAFPVAAWLVGRMAERRLDRTPRTAALVFAAGAALILVGGAIGFVMTIDYGFGQALGAQGTYLPGEVLKGALAAVALPLAWRAGDRAGRVDQDAGTT